MKNIQCILHVFMYEFKIEKLILTYKKLINFNKKVLYYKYMLIL